MNKDLIDSIKHDLARAQRIMLVSHVRPDGDAISSLLAFGEVLSADGKDVQLVLEDGVPRALRFLEGWELVDKTIKPPFDLTISLDSADRKRLGSQIDPQFKIDINIDHHATNTRFGRTNLVDEDAVATCAILAELLPLLGYSIPAHVAKTLVTGILTDSQGFKTLNTNAKALRLTADLMEKGADLSQVYNQALVNRSLEATRYWGAGLSRLQSEDHISWTSLTLQDRRDAGYRGRDDADLVNILSAIEGTKVAVIFIEQSAEEVKVSWRGGPGINVAKMAAEFGGGGHVAAAGAMIAGSLDEVAMRVIEAAKQKLAAQQLA